MSMGGELKPSEGKLEIPGTHGGGNVLEAQSGQECNLGWRFDVDIVKAVCTEYSGHNQPHWGKKAVLVQGPSAAWRSRDPPARGQAGNQNSPHGGSQRTRASQGGSGPQKGQRRQRPKFMGDV